MDVITRNLPKLAPWTLLYANGILLASDNQVALEQQVEAWSDHLALLGLRLNIKKMEYMTDPDELRTICINDIDLPCAETFRYLGSMIAADGSLSH